MSIYVSQPPPGAQVVAIVALTDIQRGTPPYRSLFGDQGGADLALTLPHPVYALMRDEIERAPSLEPSRQTRWRYLVMNGDRAIGDIEVEIEPTTGEAQFAQADAGWIAPETVEAVRSVECRPEIEAGSLEVRLLHVLGLYVVAVWLKDLIGRDDLFLPLAPAPKRFEPRRAYTGDEFLALLREEAAAHPAFDSSPQVAASVG